MTRHTSNTLPNINLANLQCRAQWRRTYPAGRVCAYPGCGTPLSKYNPDSTCYPHRPEPDPLRFHGVSFVTYDGCGAVLGHGGRVKAVDRVCKRCREDEESAP